jgi:hypothetical protein
MFGHGMNFAEREGWFDLAVNAELNRITSARRDHPPAERTDVPDGVLVFGVLNASLNVLIKGQAVTPNIVKIAKRLGPFGGTGAMQIENVRHSGNSKFDRCEAEHSSTALARRSAIDHNPTSCNPMAEIA